jgi:uncharacterized protein with PQ loop repeat
MIIELLAWSGALLSSLLSVPQLVQALRSKRLDGVSAATYWLVLGNAFVWAGWAILTAQYAAGVPALVNGPVAVVILVRLHHRSPRGRLSVGGDTLLAVAAPPPINRPQPAPFRLVGLRRFRRQTGDQPADDRASPDPRRDHCSSSSCSE